MPTQRIADGVVKRLEALLGEPSLGAHEPYCSRDGCVLMDIPHRPAIVVWRAHKAWRIPSPVRRGEEPMVACALFCLASNDAGK